MTPPHGILNKDLDRVKSFFSRAGIPPRVADHLHNYSNFLFPPRSQRSVTLNFSSEEIRGWLTEEMLQNWHAQNSPQVLHLLFNLVFKGPVHRI